MNGELLVSPAPEPPHQDAVLALAKILSPFIRSNRLGYLSIAPADIQLDTRTLIQPDLFVFEGPPGRRARSWSEIGRLLLTVEVLSPESARYDRHVKRIRYQRQGIPEYWIVDLDARLFERWRPEDGRPEVLAESLVWVPHPDVRGFRLDLRDYFVEVFGS